MSATVIFDGVCNFCNASILFIIDRDPKAHFRFVSNQSELGQKILSENGVEVKEVDSIFLLEEGKLYNNSGAALRIARKMTFPWNLFWVFFLVPYPIRDFFYKLIAKNRYKIFGKSEACRVPTPDIRSRFLAG